MSDERALDDVARLYSDSLAEHGATAKGVGWGNPRDHELRSAKLASVVVRDGAPITVNEVGCGYGALYQYLCGAGLDVARYRGWDISESMVAAAREALPRERAEIFLGSAADQPADYGFASGIFNVRFDRDDDDWLAYVLTTLDNLNETSTRGFAFNLLSTYVDYREDHLFYGDPAMFFDHCKRRYSRHVALLHDYPLWEWTMVVRKSA